MCSWKEAEDQPHGPALETKNIYLIPWFKLINPIECLKLQEKTTTNNNANNATNKQRAAASTGRGRGPPHHTHPPPDQPQCSQDSTAAARATATTSVRLRDVCTGLDMCKVCTEELHCVAL